MADYPVEIIQLKARPLEEILPLVRTLIGAGETATGMGSSLVLKASPGHVSEIRKLLLDIDRPPKRLLITVNKQAGRARYSSGYSASADIRAGDGQIGINSPRRAVDRAHARVRILDSRGQRRRSTGQQVQGLEGRPAFIASGSRIPVQGIERYSMNGHVYERGVTQLQDASSGFYVVPRLSGDYVSLEIRQRDDRPDMRRGIIHTQGTGTVVRGRLGEWISLGGITTSSNQSQAGPGRSVTARSTDLQQIKVMVECLDCDGGMERYREFFPELREKKGAGDP